MLVSIGDTGRDGDIDTLEVTGIGQCPIVILVLPTHEVTQLHTSLQRQTGKDVRLDIEIDEDGDIDEMQGLRDLTQVVNVAIGITLVRVKGTYGDTHLLPSLILSIQATHETPFAFRADRTVHIRP